MRPEAEMAFGSALDLEGMSIDELVELRDRVNEALRGRVDSERQKLELQLARLQQVSTDDVGEAGRGSPLKGRKIAPKYRNPRNPAQTWAGRGQLPSWLAAAVAQGASLSDFEIPPSGASQRSDLAKRRKKAGRSKGR